MQNLKSESSLNSPLPGERCAAWERTEQSKIRHRPFDRTFTEKPREVEMREFLAPQGTTCVRTDSAAGGIVPDMAQNVQLETKFPLMVSCMNCCTDKPGRPLSARVSSSTKQLRFPNH